MELARTAERVPFNNLTKAMECLLLALLMSMLHLLLLEDSVDLLFMVVMVLWEEAWVTMVVLDRPNRLKLPKDLEAAVHSVVLMIPSLVAHIQVKTNNTTMPIKVLKLVQVMT